ncbi:elongation factor P 5-aminopentanone reductase [Halobacillus sp. A5]|uniref:elongation factor P 5-aminopentanone reductase n=1 Tax=Halobacillus sp. A5 TaxID=2880263 RepID=UPI0020A652DE|nr:SDR family oxidoreductase [Halobacillus sp. A5]MCP3026056.1 SDR family oxidoreductase [Halobacillus sp. A5]
MMRSVLIIGGSGEIGSDIAAAAAAEGLKVGLHYNNNKAVIRHMKSVIPESQWGGSYYGDLSSSNGIDEFVDLIPHEWDYLVFSPGNHSSKLIQDVSSIEMDQFYYIHVKALWRISQVLIPGMVRKRQGNIVVISSIWGEEGASTEVIYSSVKGAQLSYVRALAKELAPSKVRVNAVTPGFISTQMNSRLSMKEQEDVINDIPLGRAGTANDVAAGVKFLLSEDSSYITGHTLRINGGWY